MELLIGLGIVFVIVAFYTISTYNGFVKLRNIVEEAFSTMDVYLKKRFDLIPNLVETVKGYAKHEKEALEAIIAARNSSASATTTEGRMAAESNISQGLGRIFALSESYPELKADRSFTELQKQLQETELEISQARKYYNGTVRTYNTKVESFPSNIIAKIFKFVKKPLFEIANEAERENVKVQF